VFLRAFFFRDRLELASDNEFELRIDELDDFSFLVVIISFLDRLTDIEWTELDLWLEIDS
jgi:hypothetical protein